MKEFIKVIIQIQPFNTELLTGVISLIESFTGMEEIENYVICYFESFDDNDLTFLLNLLENLRKESLLEISEIHTEKIEQKNWNEEWEKTIQPIKVSDKIVIKPSFREYNSKADELVITIDPKMSFGTGYHQSTRIMLRLIEKHISPNSKILDVGTGTGILAIACIKLGATKAMTCDNDSNVVENVYENFEKNKVSNFCSFTFGSISEINENNFDLILANIQKNVLIEIANEIRYRIKSGGKVILSGLLREDEKEINETYESIGFSLIDKHTEDEWIGLVFEFKA